MPKALKRYQQNGDYHFITFSCCHREPKLLSQDLCVRFEQSLERLRRRHGFCVFGYILMPEHVHLLVSEPRGILLSKVIGSLKTAVSIGYKEEGPLWQSRYYDFNVLTQGKFVEKLRYLHRNPVNRGLVESPGNWTWSSYRHWLTGETGRIEIESHWTWNKRYRATTQTHP